MPPSYNNLSLLDKWISISNSVVNASWKLTKIESNVIFILLAKKKGRDIIEEGEIFYLSAEEYSLLTELSLKNSFEAIKDAGENLFKRIVIIKEDKQVIKFHWVEKIIILEEEKKLGIVWNKEFIPFISELKKNFTRIPLADVLELGCFARRFFKIILCEAGVRRSNSGRFRVDLKDLREILALEDKYEEFRDFKKHVLEKSFDEINEKTLIRVGYEGYKKGRKVEGVEIFWEKRGGG